MKWTTHFSNIVEGFQPQPKPQRKRAHRENPPWFVEDTTDGGVLIHKSEALKISPGDYRILNRGAGLDDEVPPQFS